MYQPTFFRQGNHLDSKTQIQDLMMPCQGFENIDQKMKLKSISSFLENLNSQLQTCPQETYAKDQAKLTNVPLEFDKKQSNNMGKMQDQTIQDLNRNTDLSDHNQEINETDHGPTTKSDYIFQTNSASAFVQEPTDYESLNKKNFILDYQQSCEPKIFSDKDYPILLYNHYMSNIENRDVSPEAFISMYFNEMNKSYFDNMKLPCIHKFIKRVSFENKQQATQQSIKINQQRFDQEEQIEQIYCIFKPFQSVNKFQAIFAQENQLNMNLKINQNQQNQLKNLTDLQNNSKIQEFQIIAEYDKKFDKEETDKDIKSHLQKQNDLDIYESSLDQSYQNENDKILNQQCIEFSKMEYQRIKNCDNMNEVVQIIIDTPMNPIEDPETHNIILKRQKNVEVNNYLEIEFKKNNKWSQAVQKRIAKKMKMSLQQIYKWNWDRRQKQLRLEQKSKEKKEYTSGKIFKIQKSALYCANPTNQDGNFCK